MFLFFLVDLCANIYKRLRSLLCLLKYIFVIHRVLCQSPWYLDMKKKVLNLMPLPLKYSLLFACKITMCVAIQRGPWKILKYIWLAWEIFKLPESLGHISYWQKRNLPNLFLSLLCAISFEEYIVSHGSHNFL